MCEECESLETPQMSYAEKRTLIRAVWRPPGRSGRAFAAEAIAPAKQAEPRPDRASKGQ
jgi:hypothetical protein